MPSRRAVRSVQEDGRNNNRSDYDGISTVELEKRFQELSAVLQRARDSFSCRLEEEQANPLKELRSRLLRAKERFHSRLANASRFPDHGGFYPVEPENPFQELRSVLKSARINFVPLLDQYILDNRSSAWSCSDSVDSVNSNVKQKTSSPSIEPVHTLPSDEDRHRNRGHPRPSNSNKNTVTNSFDEACPDSLHELLEVVVCNKSRSKSLNSNPRAAGCRSSNSNVLTADSKSLTNSVPAAGYKDLHSAVPDVGSRSLNLSVTPVRCKSLEATVPAAASKSSDSSDTAAGTQRLHSTVWAAGSKNSDSRGTVGGSQSLNSSVLAAVSKSSHSNVPTSGCKRSNSNASSLRSESPKTIFSADETWVSSSNVNIPAAGSRGSHLGASTEGEKDDAPLLPTPPAVLASSVHRLNLLINEELDRKIGSTYKYQ
ncbi:hypothetical protein R1flu_016290 [Riccia fluitans]|uniref:Uncharacterized protein n=1 Tax=Riccia fluitans TaxID=41844 RepID=A0ABD1YMG1_9MARC